MGEGACQALQLAAETEDGRVGRTGNNLPLLRSRHSQQDRSYDT
jgi:hypothetical protein